MIIGMTFIILDKVEASNCHIYRSFGLSGLCDNNILIVKQAKMKEQIMGSSYLLILLIETIISSIIFKTEMRHEDIDRDDGGNRSIEDYRKRVKILKVKVSMQIKEIDDLKRQLK